jgi:hypothetical protein
MSFNKELCKECECCGENNNRWEYSNWCKKCADQQQAETTSQRAERQKEFESAMRNRPC